MRGWIVGLLALLVLLPPLLGARPAFLQRPPQTEVPFVVKLDRDPAEPWLEFARVVAGAFAGAAVAFLFNVRLQRLAKRREEASAANAAIMTLTRQYNAIRNLRKSIMEEVDRRARLAPDTPLWMSFRPVMHHIDDSLAVDFDVLAYLFESKGVTWFEQLHMADAIYREAFGYVGRLNVAAIAKQTKLEAAGFITEDVTTTPEEANRIVGPRLRFELNDIITELIRLLEDDGKIFVDAAGELRRAAVRHLGPDVNIIQLVGPKK